MMAPYSVRTCTLFMVIAHLYLSLQLANGDALFPADCKGLCIPEYGNHHCGACCKINGLGTEGHCDDIKCVCTKHERCDTHCPNDITGCMNCCIRKGFLEGSILGSCVENKCICDARETCNKYCPMNPNWCRFCCTTAGNDGGICDGSTCACLNINSNGSTTAIDVPDIHESSTVNLYELFGGDGARIPMGV